MLLERWREVARNSAASNNEESWFDKKKRDSPAGGCCVDAVGTVTGSMDDTDIYNDIPYRGKGKTICISHWGTPVISRGLKQHIEFELQLKNKDVIAFA